MATLRLRYVERIKDRHGKLRYYYRRNKSAKRIPLPAPGTPYFLDAYRAAAGNVTYISQRRDAPGSFNALARDYFASPKFLSMAESTRIMTRRILEKFCAAHGHRLVSQISRADIERLMAEKAKTPAAANNFLKKLRMLIRFGITHHWRQDDPTVALERFSEGEHHTWTEAEIAAYEARWPLGTKQRTAFALHLYTGQRLSDVCTMRWDAITKGAIRVKQQKTGAELVIPLHRSLKAALKDWPHTGPTIITTPVGEPHTVKGFGNYMADAIDGAGLPKRCVTHGIRKAAARRLAEAGCSAHEIASITGHKTLEEVERYTRAADQERLAQRAIRGLGKSKKH